MFGPLLGRIQWQRQLLGRWNVLSHMGINTSTLRRTTKNTPTDNSWQQDILQNALRPGQSNVTFSNAELTDEVIRSQQSLMASMRLPQAKRSAEIELSGQKYTVSVNDVIKVNRLNEWQVGQTVFLDNICAVYADAGLILGRPHISNDIARIEAVVLEQAKDEKIWIEKTKKRKHYHKRFSHRQRVTVLRIRAIDLV